MVHWSIYPTFTATPWRQDGDATATARRRRTQKKNRHRLADGVAVRKTTVDDTGMDKLDRPILFRKKRLKEFRGRGRLYSWLRAHSEKIAAGMACGEYSWAQICAECNRHGVVGKHGEPPTRKAASKAWRTLCRDLAVSGETPTGRLERPKPPSRFPRGWIPPVVSEREIPVPAYLRPPGTALVPPPLPPLPKPPAGEADRPKLGSKEAVLAQMEKADWHLMGGRRRARPGS